MNTSNQKITSRAPGFGAWLASGSPTVAELAAQCGFGWLLLDMEHGCLPEAELLTNLRAVSGYDVEVVVRVPTHEAGLISRALDWGADAIMVPHVKTAEEAAALVRAMKYPPLGARGFSPAVRAYGYGLRAKEVAGEARLFVQIESAEGVKNAEAIAGVAGVHVLFVGPADLRLSLSTIPEAPNYDDALDCVVHAARRNRIEAGILIRDQADTAPLLKRGFTQVALGIDMAILSAGFLSLTRVGASA